AYADLVTTLMAIFIVLWATGLNPEIRSAMGSYFREPTIWAHGGGRSVLPDAAGLLAQPAEAADDIESLEAAAKQLASLLDLDPEFRAIRDQIHIDITPEGLRVELVEKDDSLFFDIGSATLKPATVRLLGIIARLAGRLPNEVALEGHTDARPYLGTDPGYTNWELSSDRANSARRTMEKSGLRRGQVVRVVGYADNQLLKLSDPLNAQNRRVSIIVMKQDTPKGRTIVNLEERPRLADTGVAAKTSH
ncbi:MAG: OmpA family protein, partial [Nitrospinota bacterium]